MIGCWCGDPIGCWCGWSRAVVVCVCPNLGQTRRGNHRKLADSGPNIGRDRPMLVEFGPFLGRLQGHTFGRMSTKLTLSSL